MKKVSQEPKLFLYRVKYNAGEGHSAQDNFHYYNAIDAEQALDFHLSMMNRKRVKGQIISVEKKNPYSYKWEDKSNTIKRSTN